MLFIKLTLIILIIRVNSIEKDEFENEIVGRDKKLTGVGLGWDYLEDSSRYPIFDYVYSVGGTTNDGEYKVPDCFIAEDVKKTSQIEDSQIIDKATSYVSKVSSTFNTGSSSTFGPFASVGSTYSRDYRKTFEEQFKSKTVTISTKYTDHRYTLHGNSRCPLNSLFISAVKDIAMAIENNQTNYAQYTAESLVKEYGQYYLNRVKIGGIYFNDFYLAQDYYRQHKSELEIIKETAKKKVLFFSSQSSSTSQYYTEKEKEVLSEIKTTRVETVGGQYIPDMKLKDWALTLTNNLAVIDKEVALVSDTLIRNNFPNIDSSILDRVKKMIENVNQVYVRANTRQGCTERSSIMFDKTSNYDPNNNECAEKYKFGGHFSDSILCAEFDSINGNKCIESMYKCDESHLITKQKSCPTGYKPRTGFYVSARDYRFNLTECYGDSTKEKGGMYFGGIYSKKENNYITGDKTCPPYFSDYPLMDCQINRICLSVDPRAIEYAVPFFGFVTNCIPNRNECVMGEKIHVNNYENGISSVKTCELAYCTRKKSTEYPDLKRLPFSPHPRSDEVEFMTKLKMLKNSK